MQVLSHPWSKGNSWARAGVKRLQENLGAWVRLGVGQLLLVVIVSMVPMVGAVLAALIPVFLSGFIVELLGAKADGKPELSGAQIEASPAVKAKNSAF